MKKLLFIILPLFFLSCAETQNQPERSIPKAEMVGQGTISSEFPEFSTSVNADHDILFFNRTTPDRSSMRLMFSRLENGEWTEPDTLPFSTGEYLDVDPYLTPDGNRLYFTSDRPKDSTSTFENLDTWYVDRTEDGWSEPTNPGYPLNSDSTEIFVSMTQSRNAYFVSERDYRVIMVSKFENGEYQGAEKIELKLRGELIYASNPCIASDESFLIVAARDPEGSGRPDLFVTWNENGQWTELTNLGAAVNTPYAEFAPGISKDDKILYFSSERPGMMPEQEEGVRPPGDIYQIDIQAVLAELKVNVDK